MQDAKPGSHTIVGTVCRSTRRVDNEVPVCCVGWRCRATGAGVAAGNRAGARDDHLRWSDQSRPRAYADQRYAASVSVSGGAVSQRQELPRTCSGNISRFANGNACRARSLVCTSTSSQQPAGSWNSRKPSRFSVGLMPDYLHQRIERGFLSLASPFGS